MCADVAKKREESKGGDGIMVVASERIWLFAAKGVYGIVWKKKRTTNEW